MGLEAATSHPEEEGCRGKGQADEPDLPGTSDSGSEGSVGTATRSDVQPRSLSKPHFLSTGSTRTNVARNAATTSADLCLEPVTSFDQAVSGDMGNPVPFSKTQEVATCDQAVSRSWLWEGAADTEGGRALTADEKRVAINAMVEAISTAVEAGDLDKADALALATEPQLRPLPLEATHQAQDVMTSATAAALEAGDLDKAEILATAAENVQRYKNHVAAAQGRRARSVRALIEQDCLLELRPKEPRALAVPQTDQEHIDNNPVSNAEGTCTKVVSFSACSEWVERWIDKNADPDLAGSSPRNLALSRHGIEHWARASADLETWLVNSNAAAEAQFDIDNTLDGLNSLLTKTRMASQKCLLELLLGRGVWQPTVRLGFGAQTRTQILLNLPHLKLLRSLLFSSIHPKTAPSGAVISVQEKLQALTVVEGLCVQIPEVCVPMVHEMGGVNILFRLLPRTLEDATILAKSGVDGNTSGGQERGTHLLSGYLTGEPYDTVSSDDEEGLLPSPTSRSFLTTSISARTCSEQVTTTHQTNSAKPFSLRSVALCVGALDLLTVLIRLDASGHLWKTSTVADRNARLQQIAHLALQQPDSTMRAKQCRDGAQMCLAAYIACRPGEATTAKSVQQRCEQIESLVSAPLYSQIMSVCAQYFRCSIKSSLGSSFSNLQPKSPTEQALRSSSILQRSGDTQLTVLPPAEIKPTSHSLKSTQVSSRPKHAVSPDLKPGRGERTHPDEFVHDLSKLDLQMNNDLSQKSALTFSPDDESSVSDHTSPQSASDVPAATSTDSNSVDTQSGTISPTTQELDDVLWKSKQLVSPSPILPEQAGHVQLLSEQSSGARHRAATRLQALWRGASTRDKYWASLEAETIELESQTRRLARVHAIDSQGTGFDDLLESTVAPRKALVSSSHNSVPTPRMEPAKVLESSLETTPGALNSLHVQQEKRTHGIDDKLQCYQLSQGNTSPSSSSVQLAARVMSRAAAAGLPPSPAQAQLAKLTRQLAQLQKQKRGDTKQMITASPPRPTYEEEL